MVLQAVHSNDCMEDWNEFTQFMDTLVHCALRRNVLSKSQNIVMVEMSFVKRI